MAELGLRERKKLATRRALAMAAWRLAFERGLEQTRVEDIAAEAGVSPRTFNNYFSSKEDAMVYLAVDRAAQICAGLRERPSGESLADALGQLFVAQYVGGRSTNEEGLAQLQRLISSQALSGAYLKALVATERPLAEAIAERTGTDVARDLYPNVLAAAVSSAVRAAIVYWLNSGVTTGLAPLLRQAIEQVVSGASERRIERADESD